MRKIISAILAIMMLITPVIPEISYAATGHINGCPNTGMDTSCCTKTFRITPKPGYRVVDVIVNGVNMGPLSSYTFTNIIGPQTLKVITQKIEDATTYTVSYNTNGGSEAPASQEKTHGVDLTLTSDVPTKSGSTFVCWNTRADGNGTDYNSGAPYTLNESVTLYAKWSTANYEVVLNPMGGTGGTASVIATLGQKLPTPITVPTKEGHVFGGYYTAPDGTGDRWYYANGSSVDSQLWNLTSDGTLYAKWTANTYTVSYNTNGGSSAPASQTKTHGQSITLSTATPTKTNCLFLGWAKSSTATTAQYASGATYTDEGDVTLYAVWENLASQMPDFVYTKTDSSFAGTGYERITQSKVGGVQNWQIKVKADGQITFNKVVDKVDIFLVGGGGGASVGTNGGGGGYTTTIRGVEVQEGITYVFDVGAGGLGNITGTQGNGSPSKVLKLVNSNPVQIAIANGGYSGANGGNGGSGGGGRGGYEAGGSDGSDGEGNDGSGQGHTTSEFGEGGTLYAGGGGGCGQTNWGYNSGGEGGTGGGGSAAYGDNWGGANGEDGEANTGGGAGAGYEWWNDTDGSEKPGGNGGSGIIIIRNAR